MEIRGSCRNLWWVSSLSMYLCGLCVLSHADLPPEVAIKCTLLHLFLSALQQIFSPGSCSSLQPISWSIYCVQPASRPRGRPLLLALVSLLLLLLSLNTARPSSRKHTLGLRGHCPSSQPGKSSQAVRCTVGTAAEVDGEARGCPYPPCLARGYPLFSVSAGLPALLFFSLTLSVWPVVENKLLLPINQDPFARTVWEGELLHQQFLAGLSGRQRDEE